MPQTTPGRLTAVRPLAVIIVLATVTTMVFTTILWRRSSSSSTPISQLLRSDPAPASAGHRATVADGVLPDGVTVFEDEYPGVAGLESALAQAVREAATDAGDEGIEFQVHSGWRSARYQDLLLSEAISEYGSREEAARWVASADTSAHVAGGAVDLGPVDATTWLAENGARYGLCQIYRNEPWHYELRPRAVGAGCPPMYTDPTEDPRMHR